MELDANKVIVKLQAEIGRLTVELVKRDVVIDDLVEKLDQVYQSQAAEVPTPPAKR